MLMAELRHLRARPAADAPPSCSSGSTWSRRPTKPARHLLRRHEAPPRPRHDPGRRAADHLPRRADHRPATRAAATPCGTSCAASSPDGHRLRSPPSTWRRPTSSPTASRCSTTARSSPRAPPDELKRRIPGGHVRLQFADPRGARTAPPSLSRGLDPRTTRRSPSTSPSDGGHARPCATPCDRLDSAGIEVARAVHAHPRPRRRVLRPHRAHHEQRQEVHRSRRGAHHDRAVATRPAPRARTSMRRLGSRCCSAASIQLPSAAR